MPLTSEVISKYVDIKSTGRDKYVCICPFHDDHDPSMKINDQKGIWKCFVCGKGGNANSFVYEYNKLKGIPFKKQLIKIDKPKDIGGINEFKPIMPIMPYFEQPSFRHIELGIPSQTWMYTNEAGQPMFYVCRFAGKNGKKEVLPYIYATNGKQTRWVWKGLKGNRPLYRLHRIVRNQTICIVEGEKAADAGNNNSDRYVFTTFPGGSNAYMLADYSSLNGKDIVIIDDNDDSGHKCMDGVESILKGKINSIRRVSGLTSVPEKWDIADSVWEKGELDQFIERNAK